MASDAHFYPRILVVGERHGSLVGETVHLAGEYDLAATCCTDIYSAATELARHPGRFLMVIGAFRQLARGKGCFFALARRNGVHCCGLLGRAADVERERILAAARWGVRLAGEVADVRGFLDERLAAGGRRGPETDAEDLLGEEFRATGDELKALLGQETDG
jgi:hypothetical protein